jgi:predicted nucleic acid-binding protein
MTGSMLLDTNVLVYAIDPAAAAKQRRTVETMDRLVQRGAGCLSTQVLGEFFRVATEKLSKPLGLAEAHRQVSRLIEAWPVLSVTPLIVLEATRGVRDFRLAYWDAQLWATARLNQIGMVLSEDFQDRRLIDGVRFLNPFTPFFDLATLL